MTLWEDMERVLLKERALLLAGRIGDLTGLSERKVSLIEGMGSEPPRAPDHIRALAEGNARLLDAAGRGIKAALQRLEDARASGTTRTYDGSGRVRALQDARPGRGTRV